MSDLPKIGLEKPDVFLAELEKKHGLNGLLYVKIVVQTYLFGVEIKKAPDRKEAGKLIDHAAQTMAFHSMTYPGELDIDQVFKDSHTLRDFGIAAIREQHELEVKNGQA